MEVAGNAHTGRPAGGAKRRSSMRKCGRPYPGCTTRWLRFKRLIGLRECYFEINRIEGEWGIWRCRCGSEHAGFKEGIVVKPGETVCINIATEF
jgi:hypothetical protein